MVLALVFEFWTRAWSEAEQWTRATELAYLKFYAKLNYWPVPTKTILIDFGS